MFGSIDRSKGLLFCTYDLSGNIRKTQDDMRQEIERLDGNRLLNTAPTDLAAHFSEKFKIEPINLLRDRWYADTTEVQVDVRYDRRRFIDDTSRPVFIPGERTEVRIPFTGEADLFYSQGNMMTTSPPRAVIVGNELVLRFESPADSPQEVRPLVDRELQSIEQYIASQKPMIDAHKEANDRCTQRSPAWLGNADDRAAKGPTACPIAESLCTRHSN
jgi:hypothetical protein